jgi:hypothetical protein
MTRWPAISVTLAWSYGGGIPRKEFLLRLEGAVL